MKPATLTRYCHIFHQKMGKEVPTLLNRIRTRKRFQLYPLPLGALDTADRGDTADARLDAFPVLLVPAEIRTTGSGFCNQTGLATPVKGACSDGRGRGGGKWDCPLPRRGKPWALAAPARRPMAQNRGKNACGGKISPFFGHFSPCTGCFFRQRDFNHQVHFVGRTSFNPRKP